MFSGISVGFYILRYQAVSKEARIQPKGPAGEQGQVLPRSMSLHDPGFAEPARARSELAVPE